MLSITALAAIMALGAGPAHAAAPSGAVQFSDYASAGGVPTSLRVRIDVNDDGGSPPLLRRLDVDLPAGFDVGAQAASRAGGIVLCTPAAFAVGAAGPAGCPEGAAVGTARLETPAVATPLTGRISLGTPQSPGGLPTLNVEVSEGGSDAPGAARAKLVGVLSSDGSGRLRVSFDQIPQPAFRQLELALDGGPTALLVTPPSCGAAAGLVTFTAASDGATGSAAGATTIGPDCASGQLSPSFSLSSDDRRAGAESTMRGTVSVPDRGPALTGAAIRLPSGLLGHIGDVAECAESVAAAGGCGEESRIGSVRIVSGAGSSPATFTGSLFIVPRAPGAVAGLAAVVEVRLGELDLGRLVLVGQFVLRPTDAGLDLQLAFPTTYAGLGLHLREAALVIDRGAFALNPSTCGPLPYSGTFTGTGGAAAQAGGAITYDGCGALPFAPTLTAALGGETGPLGHPNVTVGLNARAGDSNLQGAVVTLPRGIAADPANIQNACPERVFQAAACSATARVGTTTARVALTPEPIPGDVYLVKIDGQQLPGLGLSFTGRYAQRVLSTVRIGPDNRLVVRFDSIPDLPLRRLDLTIIGGPQGPIRVAGGKCLSGSVWDASFRGQGGQASSHTIPAPCPPRAARRAALTLSSTRGLSVRLTDLGGRNLHSMKVTLPQGFSFNRARAANRRFRSVALDGGKATVKATNRTVQVFPSGTATTRLTLKLGAGTVRRSAASGKASRSVTVEVRLAFTDGSVQRQKIRLRAS
jgi:hypothetical protein